MTKGLSLHIGLNSVDPTHYAGWSGPLQSCEADAIDMQALASAQGYEPRILLTNKATRSSVISEIKYAADKLKAGDILFLTYSGHGGTVADLTGDEGGGKPDTTWCLYDGELIDDEIYIALSQFRDGVRILVLSDSCHSGTVLRAKLLSLTNFKRYRAIPKSQQRLVYLKNKDFYDNVLSNPDRKRAQERVLASALLISGCQDDETSLEGDLNGAFTERLKTVWADGEFKGTYRSFYKEIRSDMPKDQHPNWFIVGKDDENFYLQRPFLIKNSVSGADKLDFIDDKKNDVIRSSDGSFIPRLIDLGGDPASCARLRERARQAMVRIYGKPTFRNACAATLSIFLREAGIGVPLEYGAGRLARILEKDRGWRRVPVGSQQAGDVAVTEDNGPPTGADHVFLVVERLGSDKMLIADNQTSTCPHTRYASGADGRTACQYFLRSPGFSTRETAEFDDDFVFQDEDTNDLVVRYDERGAQLQ